jgi:hypothetical protein
MNQVLEVELVHPVRETGIGPTGRVSRVNHLLYHY